MAPFVGFWNPSSGLAFSILLLLMLNYFPQPSSQAVLFPGSFASTAEPPSYYPKNPQPSNLTTHIKATIDAQLPTFEYFQNKTNSDKFALLVSILRHDVARHANFICDLDCALRWLQLSAGIHDQELQHMNKSHYFRGMDMLKLDLNQSAALLTHKEKKVRFPFAHNYSVRPLAQLGVDGYHRDIEKLTYAQVVNKWVTEMRKVEYQTVKGYVDIPVEFTYERKVEFAVSILYAFNQSVEVGWYFENITLGGYLKPFCEVDEIKPALHYLLGYLIRARIPLSDPVRYPTHHAIVQYISSVCPSHPSSRATTFLYHSLKHRHYRRPTRKSLTDRIGINATLVPYMTKIASPSSGIVLIYTDLPQYWYIRYGNVLKWLKMDFLYGNGDESNLVTRKILFYFAVMQAEPEFHYKGRGKSSRKYKVVTATIPKVTPRTTPRTMETPFLQKPMDTTTTAPRTMETPFLQKPMDTTTTNTSLPYETSHKELVDLCEQNWMGIYQKPLTWEQFHQCELTTHGSWILGLIMITLLCLIISLALMLIYLCLRRSFYPSSSIELKKKQQQPQLVQEKFPEKDLGEVNEFYI